MSFKLNDYNVFLTSLFDKTTNSATSPVIKNQMDTNQSPFSQKQAGGSFPVDFDFGLINNSYGKTNDYSPKIDEQLEGTNKNNDTKNSFLLDDLQANNSNPNTNSASPIILESDLSIPGEPFDIYNINFNPQPIEQVNGSRHCVKNQPLSPLSNIYEEYGTTSKPPGLLKKIKSNDDQLSKEKLNSFNLNTRPTIKQEFDSFNINPESSIEEEFESYAMNQEPSNSKNKPRVKSAHNIIEQRYRNKINDKFTALQMSVPTLRVATRRKKKSVTDADEDDDEESVFEFSSNPNNKSEVIEDLEGLEPARKLNKGTILTKSIEYIKFLELKNSKMKQEHEELIMKAKLLGIEIDNDLLDHE